MRILILLILLSILIILRVSIEGFENGINGTNETNGTNTIKPLDPNTINLYNKYKDFYNKFMPNWEKAIISSIALEGSMNGTPSMDNMNTRVAALSTPEIPFPKVTPLLPDTIDRTKIPEINISDSSMYVNAMQWMNRNLEKSQENLNTSLMGRPIEQFEDIPQDVSKCLDNPEVLKKLIELQNKKVEDDARNNEALFSSRMTTFLSNDRLQPELDKNIRLFKNADDIKKKATSGELLSNLNLSTDNVSFLTKNIDLSVLSSNDKNALKDSNLMGTVNLLSQINGAF